MNRNAIKEFDSVVSINVDVENDFCPGGSLAVGNGDEVVPRLNDLNRWVRSKNGLVIFTRDWHPPITTHFEKWPPHCIQYKAGAAFHDDLEIVNGSETYGGNSDLIASKGMEPDEDAYSGFDSVVSWGGVQGWEDGRLSQFLSNYLHGQYYYHADGAGRFPAHNGLKNAAFVIGGLATDYCVRATVLDALRFKEDRFIKKFNLGIFVVRDAIRAVNVHPGDGENAIAEMESAGAVLLNSEDVINEEIFTVRRES